MLGLTNQPTKPKSKKSKDSADLKKEPPEKVKGINTRLLLLATGCLLLTILSAGIFIKGSKIISLDRTKTVSEVPEPLTNTQPKNARLNTIPIIITEKADSPKITTSTILDFYTSRTKKEITYILLASQNNTYLIAITESAIIKEQLASKALKIGQQVKIEVSNPIEFKKEPQEITDLRKRLKKTILVRLKSIQALQPKKF